MTNRVITVVATVDGDDADAADVAEAVALALRNLGVRLVDTSWKPALFRVAEGAGVASTAVEIVDLNHNEDPLVEAREPGKVHPVDRHADTLRLPDQDAKPDLLVQVDSEDAAGELVSTGSDDVVALHAAVRLVAASVKPRHLEHVVLDALALGQAAGVVTEVADIFVEWLGRERS